MIRYFFFPPHFEEWIIEPAILLFFLTTATMIINFILFKKLKKEIVFKMRTKDFKLVKFTSFYMKKIFCNIETQIGFFRGIKNERSLSLGFANDLIKKRVNSIFTKNRNFWIGMILIAFFLFCLIFLYQLNVVTEFYDSSIEFRVKVFSVSFKQNFLDAYLLLMFNCFLSAMAIINTRKRELYCIIKCIELQQQALLGNKKSKNKSGN